MTVYLYLLENISDWEIGFLTAELNSRRYFKKDAPELKIVKVADTMSPVCSMGGINIAPDITVDNLCELFLASKISDLDMLVLPGSSAWFDEKREAILELAKQWLSDNKNLAAICGATIALANKGLLNNKNHTSNDKNYLIQQCPSYSGQNLYQNTPCAVDKNLITASGIAPVDFTCQVIKKLGVFSEDMLSSWFNLYKTQDSNYFYGILKALEQ